MNKFRIQQILVMQKKQKKKKKEKKNERFNVEHMFF